MTMSRTVRLLLLIAVLAGAGYFGWQRYGANQSPQAESAQKHTGPARAAVPVKVARVEKADFPGVT